MKYYYENLLANQNVTAKTNIAWVADITTLKLVRNREVYVFICIFSIQNNGMPFHLI